MGLNKALKEIKKIDVEELYITTGRYGYVLKVKKNYMNSVKRLVKLGKIELLECHYYTKKRRNLKL